MKIIQKNEAFKKVDGKMKFSYVQIFAQHDGILYSGKWTNRLALPTTLSDLQDIQEILTSDRGPAVKNTWSAVYIKTPSLLAYIDGNNLAAQITREIETCELLRQNPHPHLATYYGYQETHGRVSGLCFKRYPFSLLEAVNPENLGKTAFVSSARELVTEKMRSDLKGIWGAIKHLHALGIVHNDINPANIVLDEDGGMVLIDFDSCRYIGESLPGTETKRTHHWHDPEVDISREKNDLDAFKDLRVWLAGSMEEGFFFPRHIT